MSGPAHTRPHVDRIATLLQEDGRYRAEFLSLRDLVEAAELVGMDLSRVKLYGEVSYRPAPDPRGGAR